MSFRSRAALAVALVACAASAAAAQSAPAAGAEVRACPVVDDTSRLIPTPQQARERREMRDSLVAVARRHRVTDAQGLLFVSVDSTRRGRALFLDSNLPAPAVQQVTRQVEAYLRALQPGRNYQMLVRVGGGAEPVPAAGKQHCPPRLLNAGEVRSALGDRLAGRPRAEWPHPDSVKQAVLRLVVNREGGVSFVDVDQPSGDAVVDALLPEFAARLRFEPATLDGVPFDVRLRYRW